MRGVKELNSEKELYEARLIIKENLKRQD